ncbi:ATP-binding cassette sub-family A member 3-like [Anoplophora glabripennis]|uniref:ATP-binding cassette sub-family A member 3-like n=1 Tax=Anoplophora glabripennis TaxID=217634 RepID=UPI000C75F21F|nr:ATP-binding cassette sub-family A member 3-like [Anoplophora glabripennis]
MTKMPDQLGKFLLLLWKNWVLQYRRPLQTIFEILSPVVFSVVIVVIRSLVDPKKHPAVAYPQFCTFPEDFEFKKQLCSETEGYFNLLYSPRGVVVDKVMEALRDTNTFEDVMGIEDSAKLEKYFIDESTYYIFAAIQFDDTYKSLTDFSAIKNFKITLSYLQDYHGEGFLYVQHILTMILIAVKNNLPLPKIDFSQVPLISMRRYPHPEWYEDALQVYLQVLLSLLIVLSFIYPCINIVRSITTEKEKQLKESMKIMGLPNWLHWTAWFVKCFIFLLLSSILIIILLKLQWMPKQDVTIFTHSDPTVLILFLMFYVCATITFCFAVSVMFNKANTAAAVAGLAWFISYIPFLLTRTQLNVLGLGSKLLMCLCSNTAVAYGLNIILLYEKIEDGVQWNTLFKSFNPDDSLSLGLIWIMLIIDSLIYMFIAIYVETVFPGEYGVSKPWYFLCMADYWRSSTIYKQDSETSFFGNPANVGEFFEREPFHLRTGIQITNLRKVFRRKAAVEDLSLNLYEDQITVLLGHNGAGKTTTMSMLTGMITPTSGTAKVNGFDIRTEMDGVRQSLGLCPQHNIIFDQLTVEEHLYFFSKLKGLHKSEIKAEIDKYIKLLELEDKRHSKSKTLSGGMIRKLCVGMALCGNSKVVMLDEPTAGMDPSARRALWILLKRQKEGRTILLSTHFMDEADLLGDRIAIMAAGQLQCCGSSFFLKKKFGAGYNLVMDKSPECRPAEVTALLRKYIPDIEVHSNVGSELIYLMEQSYSSKFEPMLKELENNSKGLGILGYGISLTTMEEVFMKVGAEGITEDAPKKEPNVNENITVTSGGRPQFTGGIKLLGNQFLAMFMKRSLSTCRSWPLLLIQIAIAITFVIVAVMYIRAQKFANLSTPVPLDLSKFNKPVVLVEDLSNSSYLQPYLNYLKTNGYSYEKTNNLSKRVVELTNRSPVKARSKYVVGVTFDKENNKDHITAWFNNDAYHTPGISLALVLNTIFKLALKCDDCSIEFVNHPMPYDIYVKFYMLMSGENLGFSSALQLAIGMAFVTSFYVLFIIKERISKSKHLQLVSGVNVLVFWLTSVLWDMLTFILISLLVITVYACFQEDGFKSGPQLGRVFLLFCMFGWAFLPLAYIAANFFHTAAAGFTKMVIFNILTGVVAFLLTNNLKGIPSTTDIGDDLHEVFLIFPHFCLAMGLIDVYEFQIQKELCKKCEVQFCHEGMKKGECKDVHKSYYMWDSPGIGKNLSFLFIVGLILYLVHLFIEYKLFIRLFYYITRYRQHQKQNEEIEEDADVAEENNKIRNASRDELLNYALILRDLTKYYGKFLAVNCLCLGVRDHDCFGLLGINGAGKTTTFMMMTGDIRITYGDGFIKGFSIKHQFRKVQKCIGYCPQFDALLDDMTAKETIIMFALLRGMSFGDAKRLATVLATEFDFLRHFKKPVRTLSGGNKRKLSSAIATIGDPPVIYFDEPTTGMDPATKRYLWNALCKIRDSGKCLVLTSHSMEECEALCTRIAIMVNGQFKCLGSSQHLKNKFAKGYNLIIKLKKPTDGLAINTQLVEQFIKLQFPKAKLKEKHEELMYYHVKDVSRPWSEMFGILERAKKGNYNIEDYSLGQSSLEQVFLNFTRLQR